MNKMEVSKSKKGTMGFNFIIGVMGIVLLVGVMVLLAFPPDVGGGIFRGVDAQEMPRFASCSAIVSTFEESRSKGGYYGDMVMMEEAAPTAAPAGDSSGTGGQSAPRYSETNVQVEGVDEADIVKTDGKYIYTLSKGRLVIAEAYPASNAKILSTLDLGGFRAQEMFIDGNTVLIFGNEYRNFDYGVPKIVSPQDPSAPMPEIYPPPRRSMSMTVLQLWDTSNKRNPKLERSVEFEGNYMSSRKIGSMAYFVINSYPNYYIMEDSPNDIVPIYRDVQGGVVAQDYAPVAPCNEVGYLGPEPPTSGNFVTVASISMSDLDAEVKKEVVVASGQNVYASMNNLYLAEVSYSYEPEPVPLVAEMPQPPGGIMPPEPRRSIQTTLIHKFALDGGNIYYQGYGEAPGTILNQFSMDEHNGYFRIATTIGHVSRQGGGSSNNIFIFDGDMNPTGSVEDLAPGERIYSARFMGDKGYMVTFKKVDPLFVIDLSNPRAPKVLGKLKIPGYSDYLHPIDENHLIGIGKDTVEAEEGDFAWYQGIKMAIFDVSDVEKPKQMHVEIIGDRGTNSYALQDHKAFLYDKEKNLLVIPILLAEIDEEQYGSEMRANTQGDYVFQGAYVYDLTLQNGFRLRGSITHVDDEDVFKKSGYYYGGNDYSVKRSLFIGDVLYTVSELKILANSLSDLRLLKELKISDTTENNGGYYY